MGLYKGSTHGPYNFGVIGPGILNQVHKLGVWELRVRSSRNVCYNVLGFRTKGRGCFTSFTPDPLKDLKHLNPQHGMLWLLLDPLKSRFRG